MTAYAELQAVSNFSFLRGASHPEELVAQAKALGLAALAITDRNSLAGVVRAHVAAKQHGVKLLVGARLDLEDAPSVLCLPRDRAAYGRLAQLLTLGKRRAVKGECRLAFADLAAHGEGQILIVLPPGAPCAPNFSLRGASPPGAPCAPNFSLRGASPPAHLDDAFAEFLRALKSRRGAVYLAAQHHRQGDDARRLAALAALAAATATPLVATNDVHYHVAERRILQDVLSCVRHGCAIAEAGTRLFANAERHLKSPADMAALFAAYPDALARTLEIAAACDFSLDELRYEYPAEPVPAGSTPQQELARLAWAGAATRYPDGVPDKVSGLLEHELALIAELNYAPYFLTVHDIVRFARDRGILCQGRGSAANSAVCYCLGITAVDPARIDLLFERFVSAERNEPPDIDVDFEHERREEVIQYIYAKYGRDRAGIAATVIRYRPKSAIRDVGKVFGLSLDALAGLSRTVWGRCGGDLKESPIGDSGLDPAEPGLARVLALAGELIGFPRHLSQHVGGFVITQGPLCETVPIENAAMADRTVIEWDKDDLDALGILKIDILALGMLTCIAKGFALIARHHRRAFDLASVPAEDPAVYDMVCQADTIGVFQIESRAQMSMLPRLKPRTFYDLVIEVAIVRPGPIQGDMVHPYLRRRGGQESVSYPSPQLEQVLGKTLGVPLFQEQAMRIAIVAAGFTPAEADGLRRAMATFRRVGTIQHFRRKLVDGMLARGYRREFAERCFAQIEGFGEYGFPESHAASFALLVYVSAWMKRHYPAAFACALLNSQPMGFYAPAQIVRDARNHGVEVRPVDVNASDWDCTLEDCARAAQPPSMEHEARTARRVALRLGFRQVKGLRQADMDRLVTARLACQARGARAGYATIAELVRRTKLAAPVLETLAAADAFGSLALSRRPAAWTVKGLPGNPPPLIEFAEAAANQGSNAPSIEPSESDGAAHLPPMALGEEVVADYARLHLSLKAHPLGLLRATLKAEGVVPAARLAHLDNGARVTVTGLVLVRQQPGTAKGVVFATLEDETGWANIIVWPDVFRRYRRPLLAARLLLVEGTLQRQGLVIHLIARKLVDATARLSQLAAADPAPIAATPDAIWPDGRNFR
jgi:error-prone DNA polymerase